MDASRKEAVQRGIVHLQQRFHICTENGKVISVLSIVFFICCILFPFIFPPVPDQLIADIEPAVITRTPIRVVYSIWCTYACNCSTSKKTFKTNK